MEPISISKNKTRLRKGPKRPLEIQSKILQLEIKPTVFEPSIELEIIPVAQLEIIPTLQLEIKPPIKLESKRVIKLELKPKEPKTAEQRATPRVELTVQ